MAKYKVNTRNFAGMLKSYVDTQGTAIMRIHALVVFSIAHFHSNGDPIYLNMVADKMPAAYSAPFRRYLAAVTAKDYDNPITSWIKMEKGGFILNPDFKGKKKLIYYREKGKKTVVLKNADALLALPTLLAIDPDKVKKPYTNDNVVSAAKRLITAVEKDTSEVTEAMGKAVKSFSKAVLKLMPPAADGVVRGGKVIL